MMKTSEVQTTAITVKALRLKRLTRNTSGYTKSNAKGHL